MHTLKEKDDPRNTKAILSAFWLCLWKHWLDEPDDLSAHDHAHQDVAEFVCCDHKELWPMM
jgi:hypothetical protein